MSPLPRRLELRYSNERSSRPSVTISAPRRTRTVSTSGPISRRSPIPALLCSAPPTVPGMPIANSSPPRSADAARRESAGSITPAPAVTSPSSPSSVWPQARPEREHHRPYTLVGHEDVRSPAEDAERQTGVARPAGHRLELIDRPRCAEIGGRATEPEVGVAGERLVGRELQSGWRQEWSRHRSMVEGARPGQLCGRGFCPTWQRNERRGSRAPGPGGDVGPAQRQAPLPAAGAARWAGAAGGSRSPAGRRGRSAGHGRPRRARP